MNSRVDKLERSLLEMGTEIYRLKHSLNFLAAQNDQFSKVIQGLKEMLDAKGLISTEEFDEAIELGRIQTDLLKSPPNLEEAVKKKTH